MFTIFKKIPEFLNMFANFRNVELFLLIQEVFMNSKKVCKKEKKYLNFKNYSQNLKNVHMFQRIYAISKNGVNFKHVQDLLFSTNLQNIFMNLFVILRNPYDFRICFMITKTIHEFEKIFSN